jgi:hypothetical protein
MDALAHRPAIAGLRAFAAGRSAIELSAAPAYRLLALQAVLILGLVAALDFRIDRHDFTVMLTALAGAAALALAMRWCRFGRAADALEAAAAIVASGMVTGCLSVLLATIGAPYRDGMLAAADRLLFPFLSWPAMAHALGQSPRVVAAMGELYSTLVWQPFALIVLLAALGRGKALWRFVHAWMLALVLCLAVFALVPAVTAQVHYDFAIGDIAGLQVNAGWRPFAILSQVRSGALTTLASGSMTGLIDFPSFHTAGATLLGWGALKAGRLGWPLLVLNLAIIPTIPLIGSHYFVDIVGGLVVAWLVIRATRPAQ